MAGLGGGVILTLWVELVTLDCRGGGGGWGGGRSCGSNEVTRGKTRQGNVMEAKAKAKATKQTNE